MAEVKKKKKKKTLQEKNYFRNASSFQTIPQDPGPLRFPIIPFIIP